MTPQGRKYIIGAALTAFVVGYFAYIGRQYYLLRNGAKRVVGAIIHNLSFSNIRFTVYVQITNDGDISVWVTKQKYDIYIGSVYVGSVTNNDKVVIRSNGNSIIPLTINLETKDLLLAGLKNVSLLIEDKTNLVFNIKGKLSIQTGVIKLKDTNIEFSASLAEIIELNKKPIST